jgi:hypothetical protein
LRHVIIGIPLVHYTIVSVSSPTMKIPIERKEVGVKLDEKLNLHVFSNVNIGFGASIKVKAPARLTARKYS